LPEMLTHKNIGALIKLGNSPVSSACAAVTDDRSGAINIRI